jgi:hypothetical protein
MSVEAKECLDQGQPGQDRHTYRYRNVQFGGGGLPEIWLAMGMITLS